MSSNLGPGARILQSSGKSRAGPGTLTRRDPPVSSGKPPRHRGAWTCSTTINLARVFLEGRGLLFLGASVSRGLMPIMPGKYFFPPKQPVFLLSILSNYWSPLGFQAYDFKSIMAVL